MPIGTLVSGVLFGEDHCQNLTMNERKALYDALAAWREVLWERILFKSPRQYLPQVNKWEKVLARHLEATRDLPGDLGSEDRT